MITTCDVLTIDTGNFLTSVQPIEKSEIITPINHRLSNWNNTIKYMVTPIAIALLPIFTLAIGINLLFNKIFYNKGVAEFISKHIVLRSLKFDKKKLDILRQAIRKQINAKTTPNSKFIRISSENNLELDGVTINSKENLNKPAQNQKWIVYFNGANGTYERAFGDLLRISFSTKANVLSANYRGVGRSEGICLGSKDILEDGKACIDFLLKKGVKKENILIYGYSLGGGVGTAVATNYNGICLVNDRSFSSITNATKAFFCIPIIREIAAFAVTLFWNLNSFENIQKITGKKYLIVAPQDFIIPFENSSLYYSLAKANIEIPPTYRVNYDINPKNGLLARMKELTNTHLYSIYPGNLTELIEGFITQE